MAAKMPEVLYSCEVCGHEGLTDEELRNHMLSSHLEGRTVCPFCDLSDVSADEMIIHVNYAHLDYLSPQDEEASESFVVTNGFGDHIFIDGLPPQKKKQSTNKNVMHCGPILSIDNNKDDEMNANVSNSLESSGKNASNPCSPSRGHLSLNLNKRDSAHRFSDANKFASSEQKTIHCPICNLSEKSPTLLEQHINRAHFDLTSPSFSSITPENEVITFSCPLCLKHFETSPDLELHVNVAHKDILSPAKVRIIFYYLVPLIIIEI